MVLNENARVIFGVARGCREPVGMVFDLLFFVGILLLSGIVL